MKPKTAPVVTGNTSHTRPENRTIYPALDGVRGLAFLMVFLQHYMGLPWGWTGVNIFFVLSGFLITGILFDTRDDPHRARNFYVRRTLRIFPLYYGVFLAVLISLPLLHWWLSWSWMAWPLYIGNLLRFRSPAAGVFGTAQQAAADAQLRSPLIPAIALYFGHFWSLCVEEQFYLFWPWVIFWLKSRRAMLWICGAAVVLGPLVRVLTQQTAPAWMLKGELLYRVTPFQLDSLLLGGLIALLWRGAHREQLLLISRIVVPVALALTLIYLTRTIHLSDPHWNRDYVYPEWRLTWGLSFVNVFAAALILSVLTPGGVLYRFFQLSLMRWIGRISYGAYIIHDVLHDAYAYVVVHGSAKLIRITSGLLFLQTYQSELIPLFSLIASLCLAWLSFRFYESRFLDLKERWTIRS